MPRFLYCKTLPLRFKSTLFSFILLTILQCEQTKCAAKRQRVKIPRDLDDVLDSGEDERWKAWGRENEPQIDEMVFNKEKQLLDMQNLQAHLTRKVKGPTYGWIKLRPDEFRKDEDVKLLSWRWTKLLRTGHIRGSFSPVDRMTIWFQLEDDRLTSQMQEFIFEQHHAYEIKIGEILFRRPNDDPLSEILGKDVWKKEDNLVKSQKHEL